MNRKQKIVLWLGIAVIVIMGIYPPWVCQWNVGFGSAAKYITGPGPYSFIKSPPEQSKFIDLYRLGVQWCLVSLITGGLIFSFKGKARNREERLDLKKGFARITLVLSLIVLVGGVLYAWALFSCGEYDWAGVAASWAVVGFVFLWMVYGIVFGIVRPISRWMKQGFGSVPPKPEKAQE